MKQSSLMATGPHKPLVTGSNPVAATILCETSLASLIPTKDTTSQARVTGILTGLSVSTLYDQFDSFSFHP